MSPSESNSTTRRSGCASARPSAKPACPPIAGSPSGTSSVSRVESFTQCRPPRPGTTIASPRCSANTFSSSAVCIMTRAPYRLNPWYSSPTSTTTGRCVRSASSKAIEMRGASASLSTR